MTDAPSASTSETAAGRTASLAGGAPAARSMTGQGHAAQQSDTHSIRVEIRSVNNRGIKVTLRVSDALAAWESQLERRVRMRLHRGSVTLNVRVHSSQDGPAKLDQRRLADYARALIRIRDEELRDPRLSIDLAHLLSLPEMSRPSDASLTPEQYAEVEAVGGRAEGGMYKIGGKEGAPVGGTRRGRQETKKPGEGG
ncbi:MAG: YicC/YloC family endoribonuclease, partial [Planctomycetota bacterium]